LNFLIAEDTRLEENKRWVTIIPWGNNLYYLLLVKAFGEEE